MEVFTPMGDKPPFYIWRQECYPRFDYPFSAMNDQQRWLYETIIQAADNHFGSSLIHYLTDYFFFPRERKYSRPEAPWQSSKEQLQHVLMLRVAQRYAFEYSDVYIRDLVLRRVRFWFNTPRHPFESRSLYRSGREGVSMLHDARYDSPTLPDLLPWFQDHHKPFPIAEHEALCWEWVQGLWNAPTALKYHQRGHRQQGDWRDPDIEAEMATTLLADGHQLEGFSHQVLNYFYQKGMLSYGAFKHFATLAPNNIFQYALGVDQSDESILPWQREYMERLAGETFEAALTDHTQDQLLGACAAPPAGGRWLLQACRYIEARKVPFPQVRDHEAIGSFLELRRLHEGEDKAELVASLKSFKPDTLWAVALVPSAAQPLVFEALGVKPLLRLHLLLEAIVKGGLGNSDDPRSGRVDCIGLERALKPLKKTHITAYKKAIKRANPECDEGGSDWVRTLFLLDAFLGNNREKIDKALKKHGQMAIKAYGLLPLEGETEVRERYERFSELLQTMAKFGSERRRNTRAAVEVGLAHLAQRGGFQNPARMEWAMEAASALTVDDFSEPRTVEAWEVQLIVEGFKPTIRVSKAGKALKSAPVGIKKNPVFLAIREAQDRLKDQISHYRLALEKIMANGEVLALEDVQKLFAIPAMRLLLRHLIAINDKGEIGIIDPAEPALVDDGKRFELSDTLRLAHPYDLFQHKALGYWQQRIVEATMVQPFKQAFRELYLLTPAERECGTYSNRYKGQRIDSAKAYRLLDSRGWNATGDEDMGSIYKRFSHHDLCATWDFPAMRYFFSAEEFLDCDKIEFMTSDFERRLDLEDVPPQVFSEVMRDGDLVVSVAIAEEEGSRWSVEQCESRKALVGAVATTLGLEKLRFEDNFVYFDGKRASYRIHLGSGVIHIMPGSYLCIVPAPNGKKMEKIYLPFAEADRRTTEIIAKILLLLNDHKIKDPTILEQLEGHPSGVR